MKDIVLLLVGALLGAVIGLWLSVWLQEPLMAWRSRRQRLRWARSVYRTLAPSGGPVRVGGRETQMYLVEGDGRIALEPQHIRIRLRSTPADLPAPVKGMRDEIMERISSDGTRGGIATWNSTNNVALSRYVVTRSPRNEEASLYLETTPTDYATFVATNLALDTVTGWADERLRSLRDEYLANPLKAVREPVGFLANGVGVSLLAFTDDDKVVLTRRRSGAWARPGELDVSVVEGIDSVHDSIGPGMLSAYSAAIRGCREELGISVDESDVLFLAFGVDMAYYQWNFIGSVETRLSAAELMDSYLLHAKDRWEGKLEMVPAEPKAVFAVLGREHMWDMGLVTAYLALCRRFGVAETRRAAEQGLGLPARQTG